MMRRHLSRFCGAALLGVLIFGLTNVRGSANGDLGDPKLEAFIEAAAAVDGVMAIWRPKIARADQHEAETLRHRANVEIRESIEEVEGISFAEYRDIRRTLADDPEMLARVTELMRRRPRRTALSSQAERRR